jgi:hypothetical protein
LDTDTIIDSQGYTALKLDPDTEAANYFVFHNANTSQNPILYVDGTDDNVGFKIQAKGSGMIELFNTTILNTTSTGLLVGVGEDVDIDLLSAGRASGNKTISWSEADNAFSFGADIFTENNFIIDGLIDSINDVWIGTSTRGIILTSPNGNCHRITVDDSSVLSATEITCP